MAQALLFDSEAVNLMAIQEVDDVHLKRWYYLLAGNPAVRIIVRGGPIEACAGRVLGVTAGFEKCWGQWQANRHLHGRKTYMVTVFSQDECQEDNPELFSTWLKRNYLDQDAPYRQPGGRYQQRPHGDI